MTPERGDGAAVAIGIGIDRPGAPGIATGPDSVEYPFMWLSGPLRYRPGYRTCG